MERQTEANREAYRWCWCPGRKRSLRQRAHLACSLSSLCKHQHRTRSDRHSTGHRNENSANRSRKKSVRANSSRAARSVAGRGAAEEREVAAHGIETPQCAVQRCKHEHNLGSSTATHAAPTRAWPRAAKNVQKTVVIRRKTILREQTTSGQPTRGAQKKHTSATAMGSTDEDSVFAGPATPGEFVVVVPATLCHCNCTSPFAAPSKNASKSRAKTIKICSEMQECDAAERNLICTMLNKTRSKYLCSRRWTATKKCKRKKFQRKGSCL